MKYFLNLVIFLVTMVGVFVLQKAMVTMLPYPFHYCNVIIVIIDALILYTKARFVWWLAIGITFFSDLFSSTPFGIVIISLFVSCLVIQWLLDTVFTNRSWAMVAVIGLFSVTVYRLIFFILLVIVNSFFLKRPNLYDFKTLGAVSWEVLLTTILLVVVYSVIIIFSKRFKAHFVS